jgi:uncharacterized protein with PIN domain
MKMLCDHMLGSLAKWLRILGFDTFYPDATTDDDHVLQIAQQENRLLISRDKELLLRGKKARIPILEIQSTSLSEQIAQVLKEFSIENKKILSRCTLCNTPLVSVEKKSVKTHVPEKVFVTRDDFWFCPICQKYYWTGTHYENMMEKIHALAAKNHSG